MKRGPKSTDDGDAPFPGLAALRDVAPPPSLIPGVMRRLDEPPPPGLWAWLRRPHRIELRLSPLGSAGLLIAAAATVALLVGIVPTETPRPHSLVVSPAPQRTSSENRIDEGAGVKVQFVLTARGARRVALAGDFNDWNAEQTLLLDQSSDGNFAATVTLPPGTYEYMFVVDGQWVSDPAAVERRPDGFGRENAVLRL